MPQTFLPGIINWNTGVSRREIEVFDQGVDTWQVQNSFPMSSNLLNLGEFFWS